MTHVPLAAREKEGKKVSGTFSFPSREKDWGSGLAIQQSSC